MHALAQWLQDSALGTGVRESTWWFPLLGLFHLMGLLIAGGTIIFMDLRLLGLGFRRAPVSVIARNVLPWTWAGFAVMFATGMFLVFAEAVKLFENRAFQIKMALLVLAGLNVLIFHAGIFRKVADWDTETRLPFRARLAGCVSILCWAGLIAAGRAIPYVE